MDKTDLIEAVVKETHLSKPIVEKVITSVLAFLRKSTSPSEPLSATKQENAAGSQ